MTKEEHIEKLEQANQIIDELSHYDNLPDNTPATVGLIKGMLKLQGARKAKRFHEAIIDRREREEEEEAFIKELPF